MILKYSIGDNTPHCGIKYFSKVESPPTLTSFEFIDSLNSLNKTYSATISDTNVSINIPYAIQSRAVASFALSNTASVFVDSVLQVSGNTINNFKNPLVYEVGGTKYTVTVTPITPLPDTGQTSCYNGTANIPCGDATFTRQDGDFSNIPNARGYTGPSQSSTSSSDYVTKDLVTGLTYKTCTEGLSGSNCTLNGITTLSYSGGINACLNLNSGTGLDGKTNWRLPTISELANLVHYQILSLTIDTTYFPGAVSTPYWSSIPYAINPANSWNVDYSLGTSANVAIGTSSNVRCVSGDAPPNPSYTDLNDGTVKDNNTGLLWQKCSIGLSGSSCSTGGASAMDWPAALLACNNLTLNNKTWRLPSVNEIRSIIDYSKNVGPTINTTFFPGTIANVYWASSTRLGTLSSAWAANFNSGPFATSTKVTNTIYVRCVTGP